MHLATVRTVMPPFPVPGVMKGLVRKQVTVQVVRCADSVE